MFLLLCEGRVTRSKLSGQEMSCSITINYLLCQFEADLYRKSLFSFVVSQIVRHAF